MNCKRCKATLTQRRLTASEKREQQSQTIHERMKATMDAESPEERAEKARQAVLDIWGE